MSKSPNCSYSVDSNEAYWKLSRSFDMERTLQSLGVSYNQEAIGNIFEVEAGAAFSDGGFEFLKQLLMELDSL